MENPSNDKGLGLPAETAVGPSAAISQPSASRISASVPKPPAHSPAPWIYKAYSGAGMFTIEGAEITTTPGLTTHGPLVRPWIADMGDSSYVGQSEREANASLIAAAPELLEALQFLSLRAGKIGRSHFANKAEWEAWCAAYDQATAAIAKATSNP